MTDRYLLFSAPMVRACLSGRKTQTRRIAKDPNRPPMHAGDTLIGRESFRLGTMHDDARPTAAPVGARVFYEADRDDRTGTPTWAGILRPSIHQPRWAARIVRPVTGVRIERLHDLTHDDAIAEGLIWEPVFEAWRAIPSPNWPTFTDPVRSYAGLWNHINGRRAWDANPLVWVITFEKENRP